MRSRGFFLDERKEAIQHRDFLLGVQKQCAKDKDFDGAKLLKHLAADQMKRYRAACFLIPHFCATPFPGDVRHEPFGLFPIDLTPELDALVHQIYLLG